MSYVKTLVLAAALALLLGVPAWAQAGGGRGGVGFGGVGFGTIGVPGRGQQRRRVLRVVRHGLSGRLWLLRSAGRIGISLLRRLRRVLWGISWSDRLSWCLQQLSDDHQRHGAVDAVDPQDHDAPEQMTAGPANWWRRPRLPARPPYIIAHRGDSAFAPENTLEAARRAHAQGADAWELDVHLTRDHVPVVLHDESLRRTTNVAEVFARDPRADLGYMVADFDLAEIRRLDAGSWFISSRGGARTASAFGTLAHISEGDRSSFASGTIGVPTLAEALAVSNELAWPVNVELKSVRSGEPRLVDVVLGAIKDSGAQQWVLVSSFDHADVARVAGASRDVATAVLTTTPLYRPGAYCRDWVGAHAYHPSAEAVGAESVAYRRSRGGELASRRGF